MRHAVAVMDKHQLLLSRVLSEQPRQCRLLRPGSNGAGTGKQRCPALIPGMQLGMRAAAAAEAAGEDPAAASRCYNDKRCWRISFWPFGTASSRTSAASLS